MNILRNHKGRGLSKMSICINRRTTRRRGVHCRCYNRELELLHHHAFHFRCCIFKPGHYPNLFVRVGPYLEA
ncbi:hypothetical protein HanRHA438_Chr12g0554981 [Helianthus annuus]|nr:hypothetical protein HanRHA438_Chr12g0554981 [Helianthus annuus]